MMTDIFFEIHKELPRESPGDAESTRKAFFLLMDLSENPYILDIGCGTGPQTIELAKISDCKIFALDLHKSFLIELSKRALEERIRNKVEIINGSTFALNFRKHKFDLIWSEGAIYILGFEKGLEECRYYLKKKGYIVVSELSWLKEHAPEELKQYWREEYPEIKTIEQNISIIKDLKYQFLNYFILPESSWYNYYIPLEERVTLLRKKYQNDPEANKLLNETQKEIDYYRKYSDYYGYVFYLMKNE